MDTLEDLIRIIKQRTGFRKNQDIIDAINTSLEWIWPRIYSVYPNIELTYGATGALAAETTTFDLATAVHSTIYGLKSLAFRESSSADFQPVLFKDTNSPEFEARRSLTAQVIQPVYADTTNFNKIIVAPALPSGTQWRADWIGKPLPLSLETNPTLTFPDPMAKPMLDHSIGIVFEMMDDERSLKYLGPIGHAERSAKTAIHALKRRQFPGRLKTRAFPPR